MIKLLDKSRLDVVRGARRMSSSSSERVFHPTSAFQKQAHISDPRAYNQQYERSLSDPYAFWQSFVKEFHWKKPPTEQNFVRYNFHIQKGPILIKWMEGAQLNVCYNLLDRHVRNGRGDQVAFYW